MGHLDETAKLVQEIRKPCVMLSYVVVKYDAVKDNKIVLLCFSNWKMLSSSIFNINGTYEPQVFVHSNGFSPKYMTQVLENLKRIYLITKKMQISERQEFTRNGKISYLCICSFRFLMIF